MTEENLTEEVIFIILNVLFFATLLFFVVRTSTGDSSVEEVSAKSIALAIDGMRPGANVSISLHDLYDRAEGNRFTNPVNIDMSKNLVTVKLSSSGGYSYPYFNEIKRAYIAAERKILVVEA